MTGDAVLMEREEVLGHLGALAAASEAGGRMVLVTGEAGIGKTALLSHLVGGLPPAIRVWTGSCERLFIPRPLGALADMVAALPAAVSDAVRSGSPVHELLPPLLAALREAPTVMAIEDVHWADEATLDLVVLLAPRLASTQGLVVVTGRDDELTLDHPLRVVLGRLAAAGVERIELAPLSRQAVHQLVPPGPIDADELFRTTGGNPFYVTEVLAAGGASLPASVRDAVLARAAALDPQARSLLEALSVITGPAPAELVAELGGDAAERLDVCLASGMLVTTPTGVSFRHDLARVAIAEGLDPLRCVALHRVALAALRTGDADAARLAHHADGARDADALEEFAAQAAFDAVARGAHREAVAQFRRALRPHRGIVGVRRAELLERGAHELYLTDLPGDAIAWLDDAVVLRREAGDRAGEANGWQRLARIQRCAGQATEAVASAARAVGLLEGRPVSGDLAAALATVAMVALNASDIDAGLLAADRSLSLLDPHADREVYVHVLNTRGFLRVLDGDEGGLQDLEESLAIALAEGLDEHVGRGYIHLADIAQRHRRWDLLDRRTEAGERYCSEHGLELWARYLRAYVARTLLDRGRWAEALAETPPDVDTAGTPLARIGPLVIVGLVRARRGEPDPWSPLDVADDLARRCGELQWTTPVTAARLETAWLTGRGRGLATSAADVLEECVRRRAGWWAGELAWWRRSLGVDDGVPPGSAEPWALMLAGRVHEAATAWRGLGCPYEEGLALAASDDPGDLRQAFDRFDALGARPAATITTARMRALGAAAIPRGLRSSTRGNPAGLTAREVEVVRLLAQGKRNREIATDLVLSPKTVDHHVTAVLRKLGVNDRRSAAAAATRLGIEP